MRLHALIPALAVAALVLAAARIAPAQQTAYAIGDGGASLLRFQTDNPGAVTRVASFSGAASFLDAIDFRPATSELFGYLDATDTYYTVNVNTGALSAVGSSPAGAPTNTFRLGMDWNAQIDRLRVVTNSTQNIVFNPVAGTAAAFTPLAYATGDVNFGLVPVVIDNAYTNNVPGSQTQQYVLDYDLNVLATLANNAGTLNTVGQVRLGGNVLDFDEFTGFDIFTSPIGVNTAFALLNVGGSRGLYTIDLATGNATLRGALGTGFGQVYGLAVTPVPEPAAALLLGTGVAALAALTARRRRGRAA